MFLLAADYTLITSNPLTQLLFIQAVRSSIVLRLNLSDAAVTSVQLLPGSILVVTGLDSITTRNSVNAAVASHTLQVTFQGMQYDAQAVVCPMFIIRPL